MAANSPIAAALKSVAVSLTRAEERQREFDRAHAMLCERRFGEVFRACEHLLQRDPRDFHALKLLGFAQLETRCADQAAVTLTRALKIYANDTETHNNLGQAFEALSRFAEAAVCYRAAVSLDPTFAVGYINLGNVLAELGELPAALAAYHRALQLRPGFAEAFYNLANAQRRLGQFEAALHGYEHALRLKPDFTQCRYGLALFWLTLGRFDLGWPLHEARFSKLVPIELQIPRGMERWTGEPLGDRTLVLLTEQGLGDTLQFARFGLQLRAMGIRTQLRCPPNMVRLLEMANCFDSVVPEGALEAQVTDGAWCPLLSVPLHLCVGLDAVRIAGPYLKADPERIELWRGRLAGASGMRIGIAWQGNPLAETGAQRGRSIPLQEFGPLADLSRVTLVTLQKGAAAEEIREFATHHRVLDVSAQLDNDGAAFLDTAAVMCNLDLIVTSDTSIAHLAGGLGCRVWVLLHTTADWRWLLAREDSPWYTSMRLFRQQRPGDWHSVFSQVVAALAAEQRAAAPCC